MRNLVKLFNEKYNCWPIKVFNEYQWNLVCKRMWIKGQLVKLNKDENKLTERLI